jgi:hypothetical protein
MDGNYALITQSQRRIFTTNSTSGNSFIVPDVVIEEVVTDCLRITDHPVETGTAVSDHAFNMPFELIMRCGFSDSKRKTPGYTFTVYNALLALQAKRAPFAVTTPQRHFKDMLISSITKTQDETLSHGAMLTVAMRRVIITGTSVRRGVGAVPNAGTVPTPAAPQAPQAPPVQQSIAPGGVSSSQLPTLAWWQRPGS